MFSGISKSLIVKKFTFETFPVHVGMLLVTLCRYACNNVYS